MGVHALHAAARGRTQQVVFGLAHGVRFLRLFDNLNHYLVTVCEAVIVLYLTPSFRYNQHYLLDSKNWGELYRKLDFHTLFADAGEPFGPVGCAGGSRPSLCGGVPANCQPVIPARTGGDRQNAPDHGTGR
jgi:hypothetical protein